MFIVKYGVIMCEENHYSKSGKTVASFIAKNKSFYFYQEWAHCVS